MQHPESTRSAPNRTRKDIARCASTKCEWRAMTRTLADVPKAEVSWLWPGRLPLGKVTLIAGDPGLGKSFLTLDLASRCSTMRDWPDAPYEGRLAGSSLLVSAEDDAADTIRPRLDAMGADTSKIEVLDGVFYTHAGSSLPLRLDKDADVLDSVLSRMTLPRLVVIDPISAYLGNADGNSNVDVRVVLAMLQAVAAKHRVAMVCVSHLSKSSQGKAVYRTMGSLAFTAAARVAYMISKHPSDASMRLMLPVKSNIDAKRDGLAYRVEEGRVVWEDRAAALTADDVEGEGAQQNATPLTDALDLLTERFAEGKPIAARELRDDAEQLSISDTTLTRAKKRLGVKTRRVGGTWMCEWAGELGGE